MDYDLEVALICEIVGLEPTKREDGWWKVNGLECFPLGERLADDDSHQAFCTFVVQKRLSETLWGSYDRRTHKQLGFWPFEDFIAALRKSVPHT